MSVSGNGTEGMVTAAPGLIEGFQSAGLIQPFLPPQIAQRAQVRQREGEAEQILIAHVGDGVAAVLQRHAAAVPVVGGLGGDELQLPRLGVEAKAAGGAESAAVESAIA